MTSTTVPAPLWRRLAAAGYDGLLLLAVWMVTLMASLLVCRLTGLPRNDRINSLCLLLTGLWFFGWFWTHGGQTLGMRSWRLQVRRDDGAPVRWPVALVRYAALLLSWCIALAPVALAVLPRKIEISYRSEVLAGCLALTTAGVASLLLDARRRAPCDRLAGTEMVLLPKA